MLCHFNQLFKAGNKVLIKLSKENSELQDSPKDESSVVKAVQNVHAMIDKEIAAGTSPNNVFICGFSQGGRSVSQTICSLY